MKDTLTPRRTSGNTSPTPPRWELSIISYLIVALEARDARIIRLEQLNRKASLALDEARRHELRRAA